MLRTYATALMFGLGLSTLCAHAAQKSTQFKTADGLKAEQGVIEKKSKALSAKGTKKQGGGNSSVKRYHLQEAWPAK